MRAAASLLALLAACSSSSDDPLVPGAAAARLSFFITSRGLDGGDLGGLDGADAHCAALAAAVGAGARTWRAYLSQSAPVVHARDRIGSGPWFNAAGVMIAASVAELYGANNLTGGTALTESG